LKRAPTIVLVLGLALPAGCRRAEAPAAPSAAAPAGAPAAPTPAGAALVTDKALVEGHLTEVSHSKWDGGQTSDMFDDDPKTMARTENANPAILEFRLPNPRPVKGIAITTGGTDYAVTATLHPQGGGAPKTYTKEFLQMKPDPTLELAFDTGSTPIESIRVEIKDVHGGDGHIHIRTVKIL
jgi:hypothetical protein